MPLLPDRLNVARGAPLARPPAARSPRRLRRSGLLVAGLLLVALPASAEIRFDRMSAAALLGALRGEAGPNDPAGEPGRRTASIRGSAYIDGVLDAGVSPACPGPALKPHERDARVAEYLAALPPARLRDGAAPLVRLALRC